MYIVRLITVVMLGAWLTACGSDSDGIETIDLDAQLDQGTSWSQTIDLGSFPSVVESPEHGQIQLTSSTIAYTPEPSFRGADSAVIEGSRAVYRISFTVHPVNQPPRLLDTIIEVTADRQIRGRLVAYDQDDDPVSYSLVSAPERGEFTLENNGEFHFIQDELRLPNASFMVDLSDGVNDPVRETVELLPAYGTNEEKAAYYYHSRHSHLLQAEIRLANLNSDADTELSYIAIAEGYVDASMDDEVERIIANHINSQQNKARAYRTLAKRYEARGEANKAQEARATSLQYQTQLIVDNGVENITSANGQFLWGIFREAKLAGDTAITERVIHQMRSFVNVLGGPENEYSGAYGFISTAYRNAVLEAMEIYTLSGREEDRQTAVDIAHEYANIAFNTGYQFNNRTGLPRYQLGAMYSAWATELYYYLDEPEYAKLQLARTISFYQDADYDNNYLLDVRRYADTLLDDYLPPLRYIAPYFSLLYPDEPILPIQIIENGHPGHREIQTATTLVENAQFLRRVLDGEPIEQVMDDLMAYYVASPWEQYRKLTEDGESAPRLGSQLQLMGYFDLADKAAERALSVLLSPQYRDQNLNNHLRMTGTNGCQKLVKRSWNLGDVNTAQSRARQCESMLSLYSDTELTPLKNIADLYLHVGLPERASNLVAEMKYAINQLDEDEQAYESVSLAAMMVAMDLASSGGVYVDDTLATLAQAELKDVAAVESQIRVVNRLNALGTAFGMSGDVHPLVVELRGRAYNESDYQDWMLSITGSIEKLNEMIVNRVKAMPATEQASVAESLISQLGYARQYELAETTINNLSIGSVERIQLFARLSEIQAVQDDFPFSPIATVDTDVDGRANFFAVAATPEQLADTDIELDDDADGDGVPDDEDPLPLG